MKNKKKRFNYSPLYLLMGVALFSQSQQTNAATVRDDINYQYFRDFSENLGKFHVGAMNIDIYNKDDKHVGVMLDNVPMPDMKSAARKSGVATLVENPQYLLSVAHNKGYKTVQFGGEDENPDSHHYTYMIVDRNDYPKPDVVDKTKPHSDYHNPRLYKMVTEVAPAELNRDPNQATTYIDKTKYPLFMRAGSGLQYVRWSDGNDDTRKVANGYVYMIGGAAMPMKDTKLGNIAGYASLFNDVYGPMATLSQAGDSGSGLFGWDAEKQKWLLSGTLQAGNGINKSIWAMPRADFFDEKVKEDIGLTFNQTNSAGGSLVIKQDENDLGRALVTNSGMEHTLPLAKQSGADTGEEYLNHGKTIIFDEANFGEIVFDGNVDQGAGGLIFKNGGTYTVKGKENENTWIGSGVIVDENVTVTWKVKNPETDRLSKLGKGDFIVQGKGVNLGQISVGDGTVYLNQQADEQGNTQAFSKVGIVSGRSTVLLSNENQVKTDGIYFGFRGGNLDLNGNNLTFTRIKHTDSGATLVNSNTSSPTTITLTGTSAENKNETAFAGFIGAREDSEFPNQHINLTYQPKTDNEKLLLTGGMNTIGDLTIEKGKVILQGTQTPHAREVIFKDNANVELRELIKDDDWISREYQLGKVKVKDNSKFEAGRNVSRLYSTGIETGANSVVQLGFKENQEVCVRSDYTGNVNCADTSNYNENTLATIPSVDVISNLNLGVQSVLNVGRADILGNIQGDVSSTINLGKESHWQLKGDSSVGQLALEKGSRVELSEDNKSYNTLTVKGALSGEGNFIYRSNIAGLHSDKVIVNGDASGNHTISVKNTGSEPAKTKERLTLMTIPENNLGTINVVLSNNGKDTVDAGAYKYGLIKDGNLFRLYNPAVEAEIDQEERERAEEEERARIAREEELKRQREEAERLEREKQAEAERIRLEKEKAEELKREQEERERQENEARLKAEEEKRRQEELDRINKEKENAGNGNVTPPVVDPVPVDPENPKDNDENLPKDEPKEDGNKPVEPTESEKPTLPVIPNEDAGKENGGNGTEPVNPDPIENPKEENPTDKEGENLPKENEGKPVEPTLPINPDPKDEEKPKDGNKEEPKEDKYKQAEIMSTISNVALSDLTSDVNNAVLTTQRLNRYLLLDNDLTSKVWINGGREEVEINKHNESSLYNGYKSKTNYIELGAKTAVNDSGLSGGVTVTQAKTDNEYYEASGENKYTQATLFAKAQTKDNLFVVADVGVGKSKNEIELSENKAKANFNRKVLSAGVNVGKTIEVSGVNVTGMAGVHYHKVDGVKYELNGANIETKSLNLMSYNAGVAISKAWNVSESISLEPSLAVDYYATNGKTHKDVIKVNGVGFEQKFTKGMHYQAGLGMNVGSAWSVKASAGVGKGSESEKVKAFNLNVEYKF